MSRNSIYRKGIALAVVTVFILTSLSSVYAESVFNKLEQIDDKTIEPLKEIIETVVHSFEKMADRESLLDKYDLSKIPFKHLYDGIRKPTLIDGEDWDIIVPDDFSTIQKAVDYVEIIETDLEAGYRIFVRSGVYYENIVIGIDGLTLQGENKASTIIDGNGRGNVIDVFGNYVNINNFTIQNSGSNGVGISLELSNGNNIQDNTITHNNLGVSILDHSNVNNIIANTITNNTLHAIQINNLCTDNVIHENIISNNGDCGISIDRLSRANIVTWNDISNNNIGVNCSGVSDGNLLHHNVFIDNELNAFDNSLNRWDNGVIGNYWSDYNGTDGDGDGIGDNSYFIFGGENQDRYPLMNPLSQTGSIQQTNLEQNTVFIENDDKKEAISTLYFGEVIVVPDDYPTIQQAIDNASDGDTINVRKGTYNEHIVVNKQLKITGEHDALAIIDGDWEENFFEGVDQCMDYRAGHSYGYVDGMLAQSFIPKLSMLSMVELRLYKKGSPFGLNISIRSTLSGEDLTSVFVDASEISSYGHWLKFDFPDIEVTPGETYYTVWNSESIDKNNNIRWSIADNNRYTLGCGWFTNDTSGEWEIWNPPTYPGLDFCFKTHGSGNAVLPVDKHNIQVDADYVEISGFTISNCGIGFSGLRLNGNSCNVNDNVFTNCGGGVELWFTHDNIVENNIMHNNHWGIYMHESRNCSIIGNSFVNNVFGLQLGQSADIEISDNIVEDNRLQGMLNIKNNNVNIHSNSISFNSDFGLEVFSSYHNIIKQNNISNNTEQGLSLHKSTYNIISNNNLSNNGDEGIGFWYHSDNNLIEDNDIKFSDNQGIDIKYSDNNVISQNYIHDNKDDGIFFHKSKNNTISDNVILLNGDDGIKFYSFDSNNVVVGNNISLNSDEGIDVEYFCKNNIISGNNIISNKENGIYLYNNSNSNNTILNNNISKNGYNGIKLRNISYDNTVSGNNIISNKWNGIHIYDFSCKNTIISNNISGNNYDGIYFNSHSNDNIILNNVIISNNGTGIRLYKSNCNNTISGNNISENNYNGMYICDSSCNNTISGNNFFDNIAYDRCNNTWDNGLKGNYWDDYKEKYPDARKKWLRNIWDTPYDIPGGDNQDRYPLIRPYSKPKTRTSSFISNDFIESLKRFPLLEQFLRLYWVNFDYHPSKRTI